MANPNIEVWGAPSTWQNCKYRAKYNVTAPTEIKAIIPKIADFGSDDGSLYAGNLHGKTPINTMIDLSISPCGQDAAASVFGKIGLFYNYQNADANKVPNTVIENTDIINWFFYDGYYGGTGGYLSSGNKHCRDRQNAAQKWSPEMTMINNWNGYINPFIYYEVRSLMCQVVVATINGYDTYGQPVIDWRTAYDWKTNFPTRKICDVRLQTYTYMSNTDTTITYYGVIEGDSYTMNGIAVMLETTDEYSTDIIDFANMNNGKWAMYSLFGVNINSNWYTGDCFYMCGYDCFDNQEYKSIARSGDTEHGWSVWTEIPYSVANYERIMRMVACFGMLFTDTGEFTFRLDGNDNNLCVPVIGDDGVAHGDYTRGADTLNNDFLQLDSIRDKNYNPYIPHDTNSYSNTTSFNSVSAGASMTKRYVLDKVNVDKLADDLWTISSALATVQGVDDYDNYEAKVIDNFLVTNPIDCIVSLKRFPFEVPHTFSNTKTAVKLGKSDATAEGYATYNIFNTVEFTGIDIYPRFEDSFLDYSLYTEYELYVPFCGTIKLNAGDILGHTLNCRLQIDLLTGACTAYIMADGLVIETAVGNCACELQVTGTDTTYMNSAITSAITTARNAKTQKEIADLSTISPAGLFSAVANPWKAAGEKTTAETNLYQADYNLQHMQTPVHSMGTASALTGWYQEFNARLIIYYPTGDAILDTVPPKLANLSTYAHTTGFATVANDVLNNYSGLTVATNPILNFAATATEKDMISAALQGGVFI